MSDTVNIPDLLQAGYYKTSRSRSRSPAPNSLDRGPSHRRHRSEQAFNDSQRRSGLSRTESPPIRLPPPPRYQHFVFPRRFAPPSPTVDDEESILAIEPRYSRTFVPEEEPTSKGYLDQDPIMIEVHEYNPERRFVLPKDGIAVASGSEKAFYEIDTSKTRSKSPEPLKKLRPSDGSGRPRRRSPSPRRSPPPTAQQSQQDVPVVITTSGPHRRPRHHRSRSDVNSPRPKYFTTSRPAGEQFLSPEVARQTCRGKEKIYRGGEYRDKPQEPKFLSRAAEYIARISEPSSESRRRRAKSIDYGSERQHQYYYSNPSLEERSSRANKPYSRSSGQSSNQISLEHGRPRGEYSRTSQPLYSSQKPIITQQNRGRSIPRTTEAEEPRLERSSSRRQTLVSSASTRAGEKPPLLRPTAGINVAKGLGSPGQSSLPYPEETPSYVYPPSASREYFDGLALPLRMPDIPPKSTQSAEYKAADQIAIPSDASMPDSKEWRLSTFDSGRDGVRLERPAESGRRYLESRNQYPSERLPNCPRMEAVTGKHDWLTLPRTDFNICPDCYGRIFSDSEYRTHFNPLLRPTTDAIACDFGTSPWYRIAWLLILKNGDRDLKVFHDISAISSSVRGHECPGSRKTARDWYTIEDPATKQPVPEFTVCHQCALTVEAILPNLAGIFVPLGTRPTRSTCSLRFTPGRDDFMLYFDSFKATADKVERSRKGPDLKDLESLALRLGRLSVYDKCREDKPVVDGYWHFMRYLPAFTVCADCFEEVVQPRLMDENAIARKFYKRPQKLAQATCQLYSPRMRDVFRKACRRNDFTYLEDKVTERLAVELDIKNKLAWLVREGRGDVRAEKQMDDLFERWREWE